MSLVEALTGSEDYHSRQCKLCMIIERIDDEEERGALVRALADSRCSTTRIHQALMGEGYLIGYSSVARHRSNCHEPGR